MIPRLDPNASSRTGTQEMCNATSNSINDCCSSCAAINWRCNLLNYFLRVPVGVLCTFYASTAEPGQRNTEWPNFVHHLEHSQHASWCNNDRIMWMETGVKPANPGWYFYTETTKWYSGKAHAWQWMNSISMAPMMQFMYTKCLCISQECNRRWA